MSKKEKIEEVFKLANNALYFGDNSDYRTALWDIMKVLNPKKFEKEVYSEDLKYIE